MKCIMAMVAVLALPALAFGAASMSLTAHGSSATTVSVVKGNSVVIDLQIDFDDTLGCEGFNLALREATGGVFDITARSMPLGHFGPLVDDETLFPYDVADDNVLGNLGGDHKDAGHWAYTGSDQVFLELTLLADASATETTYTVMPGRFNKFVAASVSVKDNTGLVDQTPLGLNGIDICVTPEPASMLLLVGALPFLRRRRSA